MTADISFVFFLPVCVQGTDSGFQAFAGNVPGRAPWFSDYFASALDFELPEESVPLIFLRSLSAFALTGEA